METTHFNSVSKNMAQSFVEMYRSVRKSALRITLPYLLAGAAWIILSDRLLAWIVNDPQDLTALQTFKGWLFVLLSAVLIYGIAFRHIKTLSESEQWLKSSLHALSESERRMHTLLGNLPGMAYRCRNDVPWPMEFVSAGARELTGYEPVELAGQSATVRYSEIVFAADQAHVKYEVDLALKAGRAYELNYRIIRKDGQIRWVWEKGCSVGDSPNDTTVLEGFVIDITERVYAEEQVREAQRLKTVGQAAASILHDLKNPMQVILGSAEFLAEDPADPEERRELVNSIQNQVGWMLSMSRELLEYVRGEISLHTEDCDLHQECVALVNTYGDTFRADGVDLSLTISVGTETPVSVKVDRVKIARALMNLLSNAKEAMPNGGQIVLSLHANDVEVRLDVRDNGPGIPTDLHDTLFEPFVTHGKSKGTGLGLAITRAIIDEHSGSITFESNRASGTCFTIRLPRQSQVEHDESSERADLTLSVD